jgi:hypothetical protein
MSEKKLRETKVGQWLREKAPSVLDVVGDVLPDRGVLGVIKNLVDRDPTLDSESFKARTLNQTLSLLSLYALLCLFCYAFFS